MIAHFVRCPLEAANESPAVPPITLSDEPHFESLFYTVSRFTAFKGAINKYGLKEPDARALVEAVLRARTRMVKDAEPASRGASGEPKPIRCLNRGEDRSWCVKCKHWGLNDMEGGDCGLEQGDDSQCPMMEVDVNELPPVTVAEAQEAIDALDTELCELDDESAAQGRERDLENIYRLQRIALALGIKDDRSEPAEFERKILSAIAQCVQQGAASGVRASTCSCADYARESDKLNAPLILAQARNPHLTQTPEFAFKRWAFCPWCGGKVAGSLPEAQGNTK